LQLGFRDPFLDQLIKGSEVERPNEFRRFLTMSVAGCSESSDLSLELVVELP